MGKRPPQVTIERVEIAGYKSIAETQLDLKRINVLIGANGAGKSNLVSFFHMLRASLTRAWMATSGRRGELRHSCTRERNRRDRFTVPCECRPRLVSARFIKAWCSGHPIR